jgi:hypothetical protein
MNVFNFFHIQRLHVFASTLPYFRWAFCAAWIIDFLLHRLWCS